MTASTPRTTRLSSQEVRVWADVTTIEVSYVAPAAMAQRYGIPSSLTRNLAGISALTDTLIGA